MSYKGSGKKFMDVVTYTGNGGTQSIDGLEFSPDLVWIKMRSSTENHWLFDTVRGSDKALYSDLTSVENTYTNSLTSFNPDGFSLGSRNGVNVSGEDMVAWCWNAGDTTEEIAAGSLNSSVYNIGDWLGGFTVSSSTIYNAIGAFDGNEVTYASGQVNNSQLVVTAPSPIANVTKVEVHRPGGLSSPNNTAQVNDGDQVTFGESVWTTAYEGAPITFTSLTIQGSSGDVPFLGVVKINGVILLDETAESVTTVASYPSLPSTVRANQDAGFSVVKYVGNGGNTASQVAHGLGRQPKFMMVKNLDRDTNWEVYHDSTPGNLYYLNTTADKQVSTAFTGTDENTFTVADTIVNATGENIVAYVWSEVPGYSKFGSYSGESNGSGFVYLGFKARWIMIKRTDAGSTGAWYIWDTERDTNDVHGKFMQANVNTGEASGTYFYTTSTGFKHTDNFVDQSGAEYIYMAFAEQPFGKAQKKQLTFSSSQDFDEILKDDVLTQYPNATASGSVTSKNKEASTIDVYSDGTGSDFAPNTNQTTTKPVTPPSNKRWTWSAWVKRSELGTSQNVFSAGGLNIAFGENDKLSVGISPFTYYYVSGTPSNLNDVLTNGTLYTGQNIATDQNFVMVNTGGEVRSGSAFLTVGGFRFGLDNSRPGGYYAADGTRFGGGGTYNESNWTDMFFTTRDQEQDYDATYGIYTNSEVSYILMGNYQNSSAQPAQPGVGGLVTTETFTDVSVWMHVLVSCDIVSGEGFKLYVNGDEVTAFDVKSQPGVGASTTINTTGVDQFIGTDLSGYVADIQFIDGQVITPDRLLRNNDTREGQLYPTRYDGWYGTRGYRLPMSTTEPKSSEIVGIASAAVTLPGFSISGGYNVYGDGPCYGDQDPSPVSLYGSASINIKRDLGGNIDITPPIDGNGNVIEILFTYDGAAGYIEYQDKDDNIVRVDSIQSVYNQGSTGTWFSTGVTSLKKIISVGVNTGDLGFWGLRCPGDGVLWFNKDGTVINDGVVSLTLTDDQDLDAFAVGDEVTQYTNSPISAPTTAFSTTTYAGNNTDNRTITNGIDNSVGGMVWTKKRTDDGDHVLCDTVRGATEVLNSNTTSASVTSGGSVKSFTNDGYTIGGASELNNDENTYVSWNFRVAPKFFDIQTFRGNSVGGTAIPHNLTSIPGMLILKSTTKTDNWVVLHKNLSSDNSHPGYANLNSTGSGVDGNPNVVPTYPTNNEFYVGFDSMVNGTGHDYVAYLFANEPGLIKCGEYTCPNSPVGAGLSVDVGFKPGWVLIKNTVDTPTDWVICDEERDGKALFPDRTYEESSDTYVEFTNTGFKVVGSGIPSSTYKEGSKFIYVAIAENALVSDTIIPTGTVASVDRYVPSLTLSNASSGWTTGDNAAVIGPEKYITDLQDQNRFTWTKTNLDETDVMVDTPNNYGIDNGLGGEQRGNYATLNPLAKGSTVQITNGNLQVSVPATGCVLSTIGMSSGKWYCEYTQGSGLGMVGIADGSIDTELYLGQVTGGNGYGYYNTGTKYSEGVTSGLYGDAFANGDSVGVAFDADNGTLEFFNNGVSQGVAYTGLINGPYFFATGVDTQSNATMNFGTTPFTYPAPSNYKTLNTTNSEDPLIPVGNTQMDVITYTGTGANQTISGLSFSPDLVWIKDRTDPNSHSLYDTVRGPGKVLFSNLSNSEQTQTGGLMGFNSDGFDLVGVNTDSGATNQNNAEYVAWCWNAGNSTVLNTSGNIASQVRANPLAGFSVVTWTYNGQTNYNIGHGLGIAPSMIIAKNRTAGNSWRVWHKDLTTDYTLYLDTAGAEENGAQIINSTTSSVFGTKGYGLGDTSGDGLAYCWSEVPGFSSIGSYVGNGSTTSGPFVNTGFKPAFVLVKCSTAGGTFWTIFDADRGAGELYPNEANAENYMGGNDPRVEMMSNGFRTNNTSYLTFNSSGQTYIYAAFAETPTQFLPQ